MCGRYACAVTGLGNWGKVFKIWLEEFAHQYNIAPGTTIPVYLDSGWKAMRWGLVPGWSKQLNSKYATFNARSESLVEKPAFRGAWKGSRRCLIPMSGYFEWKTEDLKKSTYYVHGMEQEPLVAGGLWDYWTNENEELFSCSIITTESKGILMDLHPRMPLFLQPEDAEPWLKGDVGTALSLLEKKRIQHIKYHEVNSKVGNVSCRDKDVILPLDFD